jgi:hypothetical protein
MALVFATTAGAEYYKSQGSPAVPKHAIPAYDAKAFLTQQEIITSEDEAFAVRAANFVLAPCSTGNTRGRAIPRRSTWRARHARSECVRSRSSLERRRAHSVLPTRQAPIA